MRQTIFEHGFIQDARHAIQSLRKDLSLVVFATAIIGLGVGAVTSVFSIMNPVLFKPLPFRDADNLAWIAQGEGSGRSAVTSRSRNLSDFRELATSFEAMTGYDAFFEENSYTLLGQGEPERLAGVGVAANFLDVLGVQPVLGRNFTALEGQRWDASSIILSHALWQRRFAGDPDIVGTAISINNAPSTIVGVLPSSFDFSQVFSPNSNIELLTTFPINAETDANGNTLSIIGRLTPGTTLEEAQVELSAILESLREAEPGRWGLGAQVSPLRDRIAAGHQTALVLLLCAAAAVMLIACVNLSSLLMSKGLRRQKEMMLRSALGAPAERLFRQMLLESLMLAGGGALLGLLLAAALTRSIASSTAIAIPMLAEVSLDLRALTLTSLVAIVAGLTVGMLPALQASRIGSSRAAKAMTLEAGARGQSSSRRSRRLREGLVVVEIAAACCLLAMGGLLLQSFVKVQGAELGFSPQNLSTWLLSSDREFAGLEARSTHFLRMAEAVRTVPGVQEAGLADAIPLGVNRSWTIGVPGRIFERGAEPSVYPHVVSHGYLDALGVALLEGRQFSPRDDLPAERVAILNQSAARKLFPGKSAVGRTITYDGEIRVIGIVADVRHLALEQESGSEMYLPITQSADFGTLDLVVRSHSPLEQISGEVAAALRTIEPNIPTHDVRPLEAVVDLALSSKRFTLWILVGFAGIAILLAALGIYGVLSYSVSEQRHEIGIRMALGESGAEVRTRVIARTLGLTLLGVAFGCVAARICAAVAESLLFGVHAGAPSTFVITACALLLIAVLAGLRPALSAGRVSALEALRST